MSDWCFHWIFACRDTNRIRGSAEIDSLSEPTIAELIILVGDLQKRVIELTEENSRLKARVAELEEHLKTDPRNSSKPPSDGAKTRRRSRCAGPSGASPTANPTTNAPRCAIVPTSMYRIGGAGLSARRRCWRADRSGPPPKEDTGVEEQRNSR